MALDDSGAQLQFDFPTQETDPTTSALARWLLRLTDPGDTAYDSALASVAASIAVGAPGELLVRLARPHVRPEALLRHSPLAGAGVASAGAFEVNEQTPESTILIATSPESTIAEVEERYFDDDNTALKALVRGDIDVLDRVMPWQLDAVRRNRNLVLGDYELPTVHVLIPTKRSPLLDQRPCGGRCCTRSTVSGSWTS